MKSGIKYKCLRYIGSYYITASSVAHKVSRIMKRSKRCKFFYLSFGIGINKYRFCECCRTLYYSVTDSVYLIERINNLVFTLTPLFRNTDFHASVRTGSE